MSGEFSKETKAVIWAREAGCCVSCGMNVESVGQWSYQHRRPRALGGSRLPDTGSVVNGVLACGSATTGCHNLMEQNRTLSYHLGYLVHQGEDPTLVPVFTARAGWVLLERDGSYLEVDEPESTYLDPLDGVRETFGTPIQDVQTGGLI